MTDRKIRKKDCVRLSNKIIERCQLAIPPITHIRDIRSNLFVSLLEVLSRQLPPGIIANPASLADEVHNVQTIVDHLALDLINVDLSHISGVQVIAGNPRTIYNLLEIFCGLHKYLSSHDIDRWHLEESLTETEEELSSTSTSSPTHSDSLEREQDENEATLAAGKTPAADVEPSDSAEKPPKTPSRRSSAGVRGSASVDSRPSSSARTPPDSTGPGRRRSTEGPPEGQQGPHLTPSGSGIGTAEGSAGPSTKTSTSGSRDVSFPTSQYSLELELPISQSGSRDPRTTRKPTEQPLSPSLASPAAALSSSSQETHEDETTGDEETTGDQEATGDRETWGDKETAAAGQESEAKVQEMLGDSQETSEGPAEEESPRTDAGSPGIEGQSPGTESGEQTARSSESPVQDSPTTETEETPETEETQETPHEPHRFQLLEDDQTLSDDEDRTDLEEEDGTEDISRQLSDELQMMQQQTTTASSGQEHGKKSSTTPGTSSSDTAALGSSPRPRPGRSAPCGPPPARPGAGAGRRGRSSDRSSASDPGASGRRPIGRKLLTRNIETIAEIHESGGERAVTRTTREQAGDKLCKQTVHREVLRKIHSAPQPTTRHRSYSNKQSSGRSICSDGVLRWLESQRDENCFKVEGEETDVFEFLRREFPYVRVSDETKRKLLMQYRHQMKYILHLVEPTETRKYKLRRKDLLQRQALLTDIIRQQKEHDQRFRRLKCTRLQAIKERNAARDAKISCLRAQRFVDSFKQQFESRVALNKSREELLMKAVFEEMLEIQRHRLRSVRALEKRAIREFYGNDGYTAELNRMHQFYEANFRDLAQMLSREKIDLHISQKEQTKLADKIKREFREYMESDVRSLNDKVVTSWQPQYRELDADKIRSDLYEANWKFCVT